MKIDETNRAILEYMTNGLTAKEIGVKVCLSSRTVEKRIEKIKWATGSKNSIQLIAWFIKTVKYDERK